MEAYDVLILGAGPGGYVAAIRASQLGLKAAVIEKENVGGVCLNIGCIPSKSLIHQASLYASIPSLKYMGVTIDETTLDYKKVYESSRIASDTLTRGVQFLLKKNNVDLIKGEGVFKDSTSILVNGKDIYKGKNIIIATGSRPARIPGFEINEKNILSSTGALYLQSLPSSMLILGSGAIGIEFAYIFNTFGVEITVVELMDRIIPLEDEEISKKLRNVLKKKGITIHASTKAISLKNTKAGMLTQCQKGADEILELESEMILVAVGRKPNTENLNLKEIGITLNDRGFIEYNDYYQTSVPGIYAIGDVIATPMLAHVASKEGEIAVSHMAGQTGEPVIDEQLIPRAIYSNPQIASIGMPEWEARQKKMKYKTASFTYKGVGKAVAIGEPDGLAKVLYDPGTHEILGVHIIGVDATEVIHEMLLAKQWELLPAEISDMIHAHPTISELIMELSKSVEGRAIHN